MTSTENNQNQMEYRKLVGENATQQIKHKAYLEVQNELNKLIALANATMLETHTEAEKLRLEIEAEKKPATPVKEVLDESKVEQVKKK